MTQRPASPKLEIQETEEEAAVPFGDDHGSCFHYTPASRQPRGGGPQEQCALGTGYQSPVVFS